MTNTHYLSLEYTDRPFDQSVKPLRQVWMRPIDQLKAAKESAREINESQGVGRWSYMNFEYIAHEHINEHNKNGEWGLLYRDKRGRLKFYTAADEKDARSNKAAALRLEYENPTIMKKRSSQWWEEVR